MAGGATCSGKAFVSQCAPEAPIGATSVRLRVDVIAAIFTPCALAAKQATREIPIMVIAGDPIGTGLGASLARPGGNITGLSNMGSEAAGKCVDLFRDMLPSLSRPPP